MRVLCVWVFGCRWCVCVYAQMVSVASVNAPAHQCICNPKQEAAQGRLGAVEGELAGVKAECEGTKAELGVSKVWGWLLLYVWGDCGLACVLSLSQAWHVKCGVLLTTDF